MLAATWVAPWVVRLVTGLVCDWESWKDVTRAARLVALWVRV